MSTKQAKHSGYANKNKFNTETHRRKRFSGRSDGEADVSYSTTALLVVKKRRNNVSLWET